MTDAWSARAVALLWGLTLAAATPAPGQTKPTRMTPTVLAVGRVKGAVVNIRSERTVRDKGRGDFPLRVEPQRVNGMGTGIVIDPRGYVLTNDHVIDDVTSLKAVLSDGTSLPATVFARDTPSDLAILKVNPLRPLPVVNFGTAEDLLLGEPVIAIGNAFGYEHTVSAGIVSAVKRDVELNKEISYKSLIQTNASINPGNSGGPLLNIHGELIGVNVAIRAGAQGIAFAIPVETAVRSASKMLRARRPALTHGLVTLDRVDAARHPVRRYVEIGAAVDVEGVRAGDVLTKVGGTPIRTSLDLERALLGRAVGEGVPAELIRGGRSPVKAVLKLRPALGAKADAAWDGLGLRGEPVDGGSVSKVHPAFNGGLRVTAVRPNGPAAASQIVPGDILIGLHQWKTAKVADIEYVLNRPGVRGRLPIQFYIIRGGRLRRGWLSRLD